jgi:hypothetical protein
MISINVDEAALRDMRPELDNTAAIRLWAQELIDLRIRQMRAEEEENMMEFKDSEFIDVESMREDLHQMVREVYAQV